MIFTVLFSKDSQHVAEKNDKKRVRKKGRKEKQSKIHSTPESLVGGGGEVQSVVVVVLLYYYYSSRASWCSYSTQAQKNRN